MSTELFQDEAVRVDMESARVVIRDTYNALKEAGQISRSVDMIANTECFERLYQRVRSRLPLTRNEVMTLLMNSRKRGECQAPNGRN